jgi:polar amino acid transport system permease protein
VQDFLHYLTFPYLYQGLLITVEIAAASLVGAVLLGAVLAEMRIVRIAPVRWFAAGYIWIVRGTPLLLQLVFLFNVLPSYGVVLPAVPTAILGFTLNEAAFFAEIIRGGILSVDRNQVLAAAALGMPPRVTRRRIVFPLALRAILPSLGNEFINLTKSTSLASAISVAELTQRSQFISSQTFVFFPVFAASGLMYLVLTSVVALVQGGLERRLSLERDRTPGGWLRWPWLTRAVPAADGAGAVMPAAGAGPAGRVEGGSTGGGAQLANDGGLVTGNAQRPRTATARLVKQAAPRTVQPLLVCQEVRKSYRGRAVLDGIDLKVNHGEVVAILGASGSGKSTLLRLINHLDAMDSGTITVAGQRIGYLPTGAPETSPARLAKARAEARIGMVFQHFNLFAHLSALDNVRAAPRYVYGQDREAATDRAMEMLALVGLADHTDKLPHRLSGGQQQRVAIARALATDPRLMLFDEPTSALDPELVGEVLAVIRRLADDGMTMLVVTHEIRFAREVADRIVFIEDGRVVEQGKPHEVLVAPSEPQTRRFLQSVTGEAIS